MSGAVLAFEASAAEPTVALVGADGAVLGAWRQAAGVRGTAGLAPAAADLLAAAGLHAADLGGVAVGTGPGSYTGLRAAIALARGLAHGAGRPLAGVPSAEAAALAALDRDPAVEEVVVLVDARRGEVYRADYRRGPEAPVAVAPVRLVAAADAEPDALPGRLVVRDPLPDAYHVARLGRGRLAAGGDDPAQVLPLYLKRSHAESALLERAPRP